RHAPRRPPRAPPLPSTPLFRSARKQAADTLQAAENRQSELDRAATAAIQALSQAREARARAEERLNAAEERRKDAEHRIRELLEDRKSTRLNSSHVQISYAVFC